MKELSAPLQEQTSADSRWTEVYDIYLSRAIDSPWGNLTVLRLTSQPNGLNFFHPGIYPETTLNAADFYHFWPLKRSLLKASGKIPDDRLVLTCSNVTRDCAKMLERVEWRGMPVIIRKLSTSIMTPTAADGHIIFTRNIESARVTLETISLACSNDLASFNVMLPRENMHSNCRFSWGDDQCTALRWLAGNYAVKTVSAGSTATVIKSAGLTEDSLSPTDNPPDLVDALANSAIVHSSSQPGFEGYQVRASAPSYWRFSNTGSPVDWGTLTQGYWQIPDDQAGLTNPALKPHITFDFGVARTPKLWRVSGRVDQDRDLLPRLIQFFSSPNNSSWKFERYFEMPPISGAVFDVPIHGAATARYWRICVRSRWSDTIRFSLFRLVQAHEGSKHWFVGGYVRFADDTLTQALRAAVRPVLASWRGEAHVSGLPVAPAAGDRFSIERGCPGHFNSCAERLNVENFGGFNTLPTNNEIR